MSTLAAATSGCRVLLQDEDAAQYVLPTSVLERFLLEGVRRLAPNCFKRTATSVTADGSTNAFSLSTAVGSGVLAIESVLAIDWVVGAWEVYGDTLLFADSPPAGFTVRACVAYATVEELPERLVDAVQYYAASRSVIWLINRGGAALGRYLAQQGRVEVDELKMVADVYMQDFQAYAEDESMATTAGL